VDQATTNFLETFPFFATLVLLAHVTGHHSLMTVLGAHLYFWGRVGYLLAAAAGFSLLRSVLCWNIAVIGILLFVIAMLWEQPRDTPNKITGANHGQAVTVFGEFGLSPRLPAQFRRYATRGTHA
jgi:hypothetical protein